MRIKNKSAPELQEYLRRMEVRGHGKTCKANYVRHKIKLLTTQGG